MPIEYRVKRGEKCDTVEFNIPTGVLDMKELPSAVEAAPEVTPGKGVCISGRGPVWLFGALIHKYHPTPFVSTLEPRVGACVVVESHRPDIRIGDTVTC